jgi:cytidylate kinase
MMELYRRQEKDTASRAQVHPAITISREFGCEAYPVAEALKGLLEQQSGQSWTIMDKALLEEVAKHHQLSDKIVENIGKDKSRLLDEIIATFAPQWQSDNDHFRLLCRYMLSLAEQGNCIIVGRGSAIVAQKLPNCFHFRINGSHDFKVGSIAKRLAMPSDEAAALVEKSQKQRDAFIHDYFNIDPHDLSYYHLTFNNDKNQPGQMARVIADYVVGAVKEQRR